MTADAKVFNVRYLETLYALKKAKILNLTIELGTLLNEGLRLGREEGSMDADGPSEGYEIT